MTEFSLPVIDLSAPRERIKADIRTAFEEVGIAYLVGHGVAQGTVDSMVGGTRAFFHEPGEVKRQAAAEPPSRFRGYCSAEDSVPPGVVPPELWESFEFNRFESPEDAVAAGFSKQAATLLETNLWPPRPVDFQSTARRYFETVEDLMYRFLVHCGRALDLADDWFVSRFQPNCSYLSLNYYPPQAMPPATTQLRQVPHTDIAGPTFLYQDGDVGGLEIQDDDGEWQPVAYRPGSFVVFMSDLMARWTNDRWRSTLHRVVNPPRDRAGTDRVSLAYFSYPNMDTLVEPAPGLERADGAGFEPVIALEWVLQRMGRSQA